MKLMDKSVKKDRMALLALDCSSKSIQKDPWTTRYQGEVKSKCPELLYSKKRGRRAGARNKLRSIKVNSKIKTSLPSIILLANTNRLYNKLNELQATHRQSCSKLLSCSHN